MGWAFRKLPQTGNGVGSGGLRAEAAAGDVEELHGVRVELASAGDCPVDVTFSAGVVERIPGEKMALTVLRADAAMYAAKAAGRNRVMRAD